MSNYLSFTIYLSTRKKDTHTYTHTHRSPIDSIWDMYISQKHKTSKRERKGDIPFLFWRILSDTINSLDSIDRYHEEMIGSSDYGGWEAPRSAIGKRKSSAVIKSKSKDLRSMDINGIIPCPRAGEGQCPRLSMQMGKRRQFPLSSAFCCIQAFQWFGWCPSSLVRAIYFTESTDSNSNLIWKDFCRHTHTQCLILTICTNKLNCKINHHYGIPFY